MNKKIFVVLLCLALMLGLAACRKERGDTVFSSKYVDLEVVEDRGTAGRIFSALAHANINVRMIDQGSSELNIIIGVSNEDFEAAIKAIYDIFVITRL